MITVKLNKLFVKDGLATARSKGIKPLSVDNFVRRVLVPETAVYLIGQDLELERPQAIAVLKQSRSFGLAVHDT